MLGDDFQSPGLQDVVYDPKDPTTPIARIMLEEREALIQAASRKKYPTPQPCFTNFDPHKQLDPQNTITIGLKITDDGAAGIDVDLGFLTFGASTEAKASGGNTIAVTFRQRDLTGKTVIVPCTKNKNRACTSEPGDDPKDQGGVLIPSGYMLVKQPTPAPNMDPSAKKSARCRNRPQRQKGVLDKCIDLIIN